MDIQTLEDKQRVNNSPASHLGDEPEEHVTTYSANRAIVQRVGDVFVISFFGELSSRTLDQPHAAQNATNNGLSEEMPHELNAHEVARIFVPAGRVQGIIEALTTEFVEYRTAIEPQYTLEEYTSLFLTDDYLRFVENENLRD